MLLDHDEPANYEEAMMSPDSTKWFKAMKSEIGSMYENKVCTLVELPNDRQAIKNKWIFKRKTGPDSNKWLEAMKSEIESIYENKVWTLTDLPDDRRAIENKWIAGTCTLC